jgi:prolipoprotein diacylglyceryltransferase
VLSMIPSLHIDPNIITIGPLHVRWYGMMIAFFLRHAGLTAMIRKN